MITTSGGVAALATDIADEVGAPLPPLPEIEAWVRERVPGDTVNPLDLTGFVMTKAELMEEVFEQYAGVVDALVLGWWTGDAGRGVEPHPARAVRERRARAATSRSSSARSRRPAWAAWVAEWRRRGLSFARGVESVYRAVDALDRFTSPVRGAPDRRGARPTRLAPAELVASDVGPMVRFADAMRLLTDAGITVAPWLVVEPAMPRRRVGASQHSVTGSS